MRRYLFLLIIYFVAASASAQTPISGVINIYTGVDSVNACENKIYTHDATGFLPGDRVLLIQMKGAEINLTNTASFGNILNYNNAGNYELATISSVTGDIISFENGILREYSNGAALQLVRVPVYDDAVVTGTLTAADWNGTSGGILVLETNSLTLNANIDVSTKGFRGGDAGNFPASCPTGTGTSLYFSDTLSGKGGEKGEGIVILASGYLACRGKSVNGGGGGNDHNAGAGGGSNGTAGGIGGENDESFFSCPGSPGIAGIALDVTLVSDKLFLGGGGGAGHGNNTNGTSGGDGGGLVLIIANTINGNDFTIINNGAGVPDLAWGDGAGGGGAGGTIAIVANTVTDLHLEATGGKGGDTGADQCTGPGGGGSGGVIKHSGALVWPGVTTELTGGIYGTNTTVTSDCFGLNNGAAAGANGVTVSGMIPAESTIPYAADFADAGPDITVCNGADTMLTAIGGVSYVWSPDTWLSDPLIANPVCTPAADITYTVTVTNANGCTDTDVVTVSIAAPVAADAGEDVDVCSGDAVVLNASGGVEYVWSPVFFLDDPEIADPTATPLVDIVYTVTVTDAFGCTGTDMVAVDVHSSSFLSVDDAVDICTGGSATLFAGGAAEYIWSPALYLDDATDATPMCTPLDDIMYIVTGTSPAGCTDVDTVYVTVEPLAFLDAGPDVSVCIGGSVTLNATGGVEYLWSPSTYLDDMFSADPLCTPMADIIYIVQAENASGCTDADTIAVAVVPAEFLDAGADAYVCPGSSVDLHATGGDAFEWSPATGLDDPFSADPVCTPVADMMYVVTAMAADGCTDMDTVFVYVLPDDFASASPDISICSGASADLYATGGVSYSWSPATYLDDALVADPVCTPLSDITYFVTVTNAEGCTDTEIINVTTIPAPEIIAGPDTVLCFGGQVKLFCTEGVSYNWTPATYLDYTTIADPTSSPFSDITYIVYVTDASGCIGSDTVEIIVNAIPDIIASPDITICRGDTVTLTAEGGVSYTWLPDPLFPCTGCASVEVSPFETTTYVVQGVDANGCIAADEVIVTVEICNAITESEAGNILIYPNPADEFVILQLPANLIPGVVRVTNVFGELLLPEINATTTQVHIPLEKVASQMIFVQINTEKGTVVRPVSLLR